MSGSSITLDLGGLPDLVGRLEKFKPEQVAAANVRAVNAAVGEVYELSRKRMNAGINLEDAYLRRKMTVAEAQAGKAEASITASGARPDFAILARYDARIVYAPRKSKKARPTTGGLSLPTGMRQSGVTVEVSRGGAKTMTGAFALPLRAGSEAGGNGIGVFLRDSRGKKHHLYGPSVYQLFRHQVAKVENETLTILERNVNDELDQILSEVLQ